ncbi:hypothetical protein Btru_017133 [Bulinus truncatus]|nr:hypothetical protein Btru_017133 [Bulinus truncatus]
MKQPCNSSANISCNHSMVILVTDVTNGLLIRSNKTYEAVKQGCMGRERCRLLPSCNNQTDQLFVHYFCIDSSHIRSKNCAENTTIREQNGFIQSPNYPRYPNNSTPCRWTLQAPTNSVMYLSLHDISIRGNGHLCEGGLKVVGNTCHDSHRRVTQTLSLCTSDEGTLLNDIRCGQVDIVLESSSHFSLKFWMSFYARPRPQTSLPDNVPSPLNSLDLQASKLPCAGWIFYMDTGSVGHYPSATLATTQVPDINNQGNNTELLIIMLSIISGFSVVLLVILIVVCIRCRLLQTNHTEYLYAETSSGIQEHHQYISSLENEKPRPHLADGYYEVADAIPPSQRGATPTSPAYAEVESIVSLRKGPWTDHVIKSSKPTVLLKEEKGGNKILNCKYNSGHLTGVNEEIKERENKLSVDLRNSTGPMIIIATLRKNQNSESVSSNDNDPAGCPNPSSQLDDSSSTYEPIGECSPVKSVKHNSEPLPWSNLATSKVQMKNLKDVDNYSKTLNRISNRTNGQDKTMENHLKGNNVHAKENFRGLTKGSVGIKVLNSQSKAGMLNIHDGSKTLPSKNSKSYLEIHAVKNNNYKYSECSDLQGSKGIVRNGIKLFEKNGSLS